jgi:hypothetical protein
MNRRRVWGAVALAVSILIGWMSIAAAQTPTPLSVEYLNEVNSIWVAAFLMISFFLGVVSGRL